MKIKIVKCDDWEGLYIDGLLKEENHKIDALAALKSVEECWILGCKPVVVSEYHIDDEWMEENGDLPNHFCHIPENKLELMNS